MKQHIPVSDLSRYARLVFGEKWKDGLLVMLVPIPQVESFADESSDRHRKDVLCVAAFMAKEAHWRMMQAAWMERLKADNIKYFRMADSKSLHGRGGFYRLREDYKPRAAAHAVADKLRGDLVALLIKFANYWRGFCICLDVPDYKNVLREYPQAREFFADNPTMTAYGQAMYEVAFTASRKTKGATKVAFVIDKASDSPQVMQQFERVAINQPLFKATAKTIIPLDDKDTPPLQMADLIAGTVKDHYLEWQRGGKVGKFFLNNDLDHCFERGIGIWDTKHMLRLLEKTLRSTRYAKGTLARITKPEQAMSKRERKKLHREIEARIQRERNEKSV
ncbi:MAG: hypothetical protein AUH15_08120 [Acidobacteriales bacterium 13_2_20CM_55_8]|nr:MAG: hypothetical protein AUH15_08120 [Acidobacteriales bacterium 13_2_20CM_55_8]